ncbi:hypothetical protein BHUM_03414 [Candidatus Burkholderia humilis]|nr:hypothetical protein BHUM_03414 [Candidatus Burkholderia humilis]
MTSLSRFFFGALTLCFAASIFAQTSSRAYDPSAPKTRAEVRQEFLAWRAAGYDPNDWLNYPANAKRRDRATCIERLPDFD